MDFQPNNDGLENFLQQAQQRATDAFNEALNREVAGASTFGQIEQGVIRASVEVFGEPMSAEDAAGVARSIASQAGIPLDPS